MQARRSIGWVALLVLSQVGGCRKADQAASRAAVPLTSAAAGCNVLLITMDTTRADRLGCYGFAPAVTPTLDALARAGVRFNQAFAQAPITLPSHAALLTGTHPPENGVRENHRYVLGPELPTLAEIFRQHGYRTGAFVAAKVLAARFGLARGFDVYDDGMQSYERPADEVCDDALAWLARAGDGPFFCWVHLFDPHAPYAPPGQYRRSGRHPYDGEVAFMDANIGRLIAWLRTSGRSSETLIVAVADHGESLGEHGYPWHALLVYDGIMRVPLIFALPGRLPGNIAHDGIVSIVDIMPTVLDLMGWQTPGQVSGESLIAALGGGDIPPRQSYGESDFAYENFGWSKLRCLVERKWKYIRAPEAELYDRIDDPRELRNLAARHPDVVARLEEQLTARERRMTKGHSATVALDTESVAALRSLGYVGGPSPPGSPGADLKDPKHMVDIARDQRAAQSFLRARRPMEAIKLMEPAVRRSPESFVLVELLGKAYAHANMLELGQQTLQDALDLQAKVANTWFFLARVLRGRGALPRAVSACEKALALEPDHEQAQALLPELRRALERQQAKTAELREQFRAEPASVAIAYALSTQLALSGRTAEAIRVLRDGLARNPEDAFLANLLAWRLATTPNDELRNGSEALRWARLACSGAGQANPNMLDTLAAALAEVGQFDQAAETARRAAKLAEEAGDKRLAAVLARRLTRYEARRSFRATE